MDTRQICRTCLKNNNTILPHFDLAEFVAPGKTYSQLLTEYTQIMFNTDHETKMPQEICAMCCGELKRIYSFITHAHECNHKLMNMVTNGVASGLKENTINQPLIVEAEGAIHYKIDTLDVKNEPITSEDLLMENIDQEATEQLIEPADVFLNTCSELMEAENIKMEFDPPSASCTNPVPTIDKHNVIEETQKIILEKINILRDNQIKMMSVLSKCVLTTTTTKKSLFPIKDDIELRNANEYAKKNFEECVTIIQQIISPEGLHRSFHRLFAGDITMNYNYDGIQNKKCFKEFEHLHKAIYESLAKEGYTFDDYVKDVRVSMKLCKNRFFKKKHDLNKKQIQLKIPL